MFRDIFNGDWSTNSRQDREYELVVNMFLEEKKEKLWNWYEQKVKEAEKRGYELCKKMNDPNYNELRK